MFFNLLFPFFVIFFWVNINIIQTKDVKEYAPLFYGLHSDFGYSLWDAILCWCGVTPKSQGPTFTYYWNVWVIKDSDETVGICGLYSINETNEELWLGWLGMLESCRSRGIGEVTMRHLEAMAKEVGCQRIYSYVEKNNEKGMKFYYRNGFTRLSDAAEYWRANNIPQHIIDIDFSEADDHIIVKSIAHISGS
jgi:ribosomal protein S18 acetylase RimI-like enzyme